MMTVLVTGAAGFIGSHLCERLLEEGHRVVGIDAFMGNYEPGPKRRNAELLAGYSAFELVEIDVRDRDALLATFERIRPTHVVHLAALAGVRPSLTRAAEFIDVNLTGTANVLDACVATNVKRFIFGSSSSVYGDNAKVPFSPDDPVEQPLSPYAATKRSGELLCHTYAHLHELSICCLRFFTVYGPRQRPDLAIAKFMNRMADGEAIPVFGDGSTSRDYTFVLDIVRGVVAALAPSKPFSIYNLGSDQPISLGDLIAAIERATGLKADIERLPMQPGDVKRTWADLAATYRDLDYRPGTTLEDGLAAQWSARQSMIKSE
ncbi:MAG: SDR family NAD(P)-dependent oxidoreductase [Phycisphaeraceae bacterium]